MSSLPKTYKAAVLEEQGQPLVIRDVPLELPGPGQVLIKVLACGVCGSDGHVQMHGMGPVQKALPLVLGHEIVGDIVAVGSGVTGFSEGERIGGSWHGGHDGTCRSCQRGLFQICERGQINGVSRDGGFAEYALLQTEAAVRLPADADPVETAPLLCAGITVFNGLRKLHIEQGSLVAVQGLGALGHLAVQYGRAMGYDVVVLSSNDSKRAYVSELGAIAYVDASSEDSVQALQRLGGAAAIVCTAPNPAIIGGLIGGLQPQGTLLVLSPVSGVQIDMTPMVVRGLRLAGWPSGHALDSQDAVAFAQRHGIKTLIEPYKFADIDKAFERMHSGKARFKVVVDMQ
ncbi:alcohol dehydrogenase [Grosmannia clavigera kw1407]|uniref:Alcohol dehydrogenase n=1 Tax=Grosmannia clavigera (strain kw1407 / UAMH 11150) TaxID=655863 RepID=F0XCT0_GROCL|nr:alcohol dehydrogenase [Grosmannia clavigera kw1407]EFX04577.1 alcohol dehydrogenase [Grosmannia clavigera kw1407]